MQKRQNTEKKLAEEVCFAALYAKTDVKCFPVWILSIVNLSAHTEKIQWY